MADDKAENPDDWEGELSAEELSDVLRQSDAEDAVYKEVSATNPDAEDEERGQTIETKAPAKTEPTAEGKAAAAKVLSTSNTTPEHIVEQVIHEVEAKAREIVDDEMQQTKKRIISRLRPPAWKKALPYAGTLAAGILSTVFLMKACSGNSPTPPQPQGTNINNNGTPQPPQPRNPQGNPPPNNGQNGHTQRPPNSFDAYESIYVQNGNAFLPVKPLRDTDAILVKAQLVRLKTLAADPAKTAVVSSNPAFNTGELFAIKGALLQDDNTLNAIVKAIKTVPARQDAATEPKISYFFRVEGNELQVVMDINGDGLDSDGNGPDNSVVNKVQIELPLPPGPSNNPA